MNRNIKSERCKRRCYIRSIFIYLQTLLISFLSVSHIHFADFTKYIHICKFRILGVCDAVEEAKAESARVRDVMGQNLLQLLPVRLGILGGEGPILVRVDLAGHIVLHLLPIDVDVARVDGTLNDHEAHPGNDGKGPANLLGGHAAAVANKRTEGDLGQGRLELVYE